MRALVPLTCRHDGDAGLLRNGKPRCPMCRRELWLTERRAEVEAERLAERKRLDELITQDSLDV